MNKFVTCVLVLAIYTGALAPLVPQTYAQSVRKTMEDKLKVVPGGLKFQLSEGTVGAESRKKSEPAVADLIATDDAERILRRLPAIETGDSDQLDFAKRAGSRPAPKTGRQIPVKFPSNEVRGTPKISPGTSLDVVRLSPEGEISLAPDLSVTFSQPMVAVTSQEEAAKYAPVELSPQVDGRWRWLGTKTLMFDTAKRFPMATKFTARIPAGTRSVNGQTLAKEVNWSFTTSPPKVEQIIPQNQVVKRDAVIFLSFDQEVNPESVIKTISIAANGKRVPVRLATQDEINRDLLIGSYIQTSQPRRWLAFRAINAEGGVENALPGSSVITVTVQKGTPSAEGPLITETAQSFQFTTFGPLKFVRAFCGWEQNPKCNPFENWIVEFNNPLDPARFSAEMVKIEPAVENLKIFPSGNYIHIQGYKKGQTNYKITVDGGLADQFGQSMGKPAVATIKVGSVEQNLYAQGGFMNVLDPSAEPSFSIYSTNHSNLNVKMYAVRPEDWSAYQNYIRHMNYDDGKRSEIPGRLVFDKLVSIRNETDEMVETRLDIGQVLDGGLGNIILDVQPTLKRDKYDSTRVITWLMATQIGLDAYVDNSELLGFATELKTGKPIAGVALSIYPNGKSSSDRENIREKDNDGFLAEAWNWLTESGSRSDNISSLNADGSILVTEAVPPSQNERTGANGTFRIELPETTSQSQSLLIARRGKDVSFLPESSEYYWQETGNWYKKPDHDSLRWFVFDDRGMYKPKEEVAVKGYIRKMTGGRLGDVEALGDSATGVSYSVKDPRNNEIVAGTANLNAFGAFDLKFNLPDNANLGHARIEFSTASRLAADTFTHQFQIQEFRRPEFEVSTKVESEAPFFIGDSAELSVEGKYYAGGGLANADANWTVTASPTNYTPPNRSDFTFGTWVPWWGFYDYGESRNYGENSQSFKGLTEAEGKHLLKIDFESVNPARPYNVKASASVQDVNRQTWSSSTSLLIHPSSLYVGIKTPRTFVQKDEKIDVDSIVSDIDGNLIAGRDVDIKAILKDWTFEKGSWKEEILDEQTCTLKSAAEPQKCTFVAKQGGRYKISAAVMDDRERFNESEITVWVPGGKTPPKRTVEQEQVQIIPSKKEFAPGETAELLVISPFTPAEGVLTLRRDGIVKTERFSMKESSVTLKIALEAAYLPNIYAQIDLVGSAVRANDKGEVDPKLSNRPAFAGGNINLSILTQSRRLTVSAEPRDKTLVPGGETKVDLVVTDNSGVPVAESEVAIVVVDESVLALSRYRVGDPVGLFYSLRPAGTQDYHSRAEVMLGNPKDVKAPPPPPSAETITVRQMSPLPKSARFSSQLKMAAGGRAENMIQADGASGAENVFEVDGQEVSNFRTGQLNEDGSPIKQRINFDALAFFAPSVKTDANGKATVDIKLPDNLTRYRITAVAVDTGKRFGSSESAITAKQPLMVRPSAPRFMNFGDKAELPVVVQNQTDNDMAVDVAVRATNAALGGGNPGGSQRGLDAVAGSAIRDKIPTGGISAVGKRVLVKANDRVEIRFPVSTIKAGTARFQFAVSSGKYTDAVDISLPVWTPATTEAFATYGTTDENGAVIQPVQTPGDVFPQFGGLEVTTSSTQLQELTDAFIYLTNYPYACSEQISSRMISIAAMRDVLAAFKAKEMPTKAQLDSYFARDVEILKSRQRDDGSFGLWKRDRERYEYPFLTVHVAHALALAKMKGYKVPDEMINKTKPYLRDVETHFDEWYKNSPQVRWTISAYALYIRDLMGDKDAAKAKKLLADATIEKMPFEALGWILSVLANDANSAAEVDSITRYLSNRTTETAATANFVTDYGDGAWLIMYSNRRADGVLLEALIKTAGRTPNGNETVGSASKSNAKGTIPGVRVSSSGAAELIPKLVRGLLDNRVKGAWSNTQENVFILLAMDKYFNAFEKVTPDFVTRIWLGGTYAGEETFKGRTVDSNLVNIPMNYLVDQSGNSNLLIDRQGLGRLYYRIGMKYAPKNLKLEPADYGFSVMRQYEAIDSSDDVKQNADGSWTIKSGARVRVRLSMVAQARRYHVVLVDNLPAGLEILNPELAVTEGIPADKLGTKPLIEYGSRSFGRGNRYWRQYWFEHQNFRDERAEAFASLLWEGVYYYSYVARATTPGQFVVPPAKAEEMYHPETFGRTGTDFVNVE